MENAIYESNSEILSEISLHQVVHKDGRKSTKINSINNYKHGQSAVKKLQTRQLSLPMSMAKTTTFTMNMEKSWH